MHVQKRTSTDGGLEASSNGDVVLVREHVKLPHLDAGADLERS
jgi:hypothetical protein